MAAVAMVLTLLGANGHNPLTLPVRRDILQRSCYNNAFVDNATICVICMAIYVESRLRHISNQS